MAGDAAERLDTVGLVAWCERTGRVGDIALTRNEWAESQPWESIANSRGYMGSVAWLGNHVVAL
jgi:hypothetical protein